MAKWILVTHLDGEPFQLNTDHAVTINGTNEGTMIWDEDGDFWKVRETPAELAMLLGAEGVARCARCNKLIAWVWPAHYMLNGHSICDECAEKEEANEPQLPTQSS